MSYEIEEDGQCLWKWSENPDWLALQHAIRLFGDKHTELAAELPHLREHPCWTRRFNPETGLWDELDVKTLRPRHAYAEKRLNQIVAAKKYDSPKFGIRRAKTIEGGIYIMLYCYKYVENGILLPSLRLPTPPPMEPELMDAWRAKWGISARGTHQDLLKMADKKYAGMLQLQEELIKWACRILNLTRLEITL